MSAFDIEPVDATFGAIVRGIRLAEIDDATWRALNDAWLKYALLIFPGQHLTRAQHTAFARRFGPLEIDMMEISNVRPDGTLSNEVADPERMGILKGNLDWHSDSSFKPIHAKGAVFCADVVPPSGGQTGWADMRAAYDALDDELRAKVDRLAAHHSIHHSQAAIGAKMGAETVGALAKAGVQAPPANYAPLRPLVKVHPETGRRSLMIGRHAYNIPGMEPEESKQFLLDLAKFACQPPRTYHYDWTAGDAVIWDNRCLLHRGLPWDMSLPRVMWHSRIAGDPVSEAALAA